MKKAILLTVILICLLACKKEKDDYKNDFKLYNGTNSNIILIAPNGKQSNTIRVEESVNLKTNYELEQFKITSLQSNNSKISVFYDNDLSKYVIFNYEFELQFYVTGKKAEIIKYIDNKGDTIKRYNVRLPLDVVFNDFPDSNYYLSVKPAPDSIETKAYVIYRRSRDATSTKIDSTGFITIRRTRPAKNYKLDYF